LRSALVAGDTGVVRVHSSTGAGGAPGSKILQSPPEADGRVSGRADVVSHHLSEALELVGIAKRRDTEATGGFQVKKTTVRLTVMASSLMALLLAGGAHWSRH
jgi:hypothetical protein